MMSVKRVLNLMGKEASNWKQQKQISVFAKWSKLDLPKVLDPVAVPILEPIEESELKSISNANATFNAKASRLHHFFSEHETDLGILIVHELRFSFRRLGGMLIPSSYTLQQGSREGVEDASYSWNGAEVGFVLNHGTVGLTSASLTPIVISSNGNILRPLDHGTHGFKAEPIMLTRFQSTMGLFLRAFVKNSEAQPDTGILVLWQLEYSLLGGGKIQPLLYAVKKRSF